MLVILALAEDLFGDCPTVFHALLGDRVDYSIQPPLFITNLVLQRLIVDVLSGISTWWKASAIKNQCCKNGWDHRFSCSPLPQKSMFLFGGHQTLLITDNNLSQPSDIHALITEKGNYTLHVKFSISFERKSGNCFLKLSLRDFAEDELTPPSLSESKFFD